MYSDSDPDCNIGDEDLCADSGLWLTLGGKMMARSTLTIFKPIELDYSVWTNVHNKIG